jgi:hypothetical protein
MVPQRAAGKVMATPGKTAALSEKAALKGAVVSGKSAGKAAKGKTKE